MKRCVIISYKYGIYELPYELPNDLRLRELDNIRKVSDENNLVPRRKKTLEKQKLNFSRSALFHMKTRVKIFSLKYFEDDCRCKNLRMNS